MSTCAPATPKSAGHGDGQHRCSLSATSEGFVLCTLVSNWESWSVKTSPEQTHVACSCLHVGQAAARIPSHCKPGLKNTAGSVTAVWEPNLNPPELGAGGATRHLQPQGQQEGTNTSLQEGFGPSWLTKTACKLLKARQLFNSQHRPCLKYSLVHGEKEGQSTKKK